MANAQHRIPNNGVNEHHITNFRIQSKAGFRPIIIPLQSSKECRDQARLWAQRPFGSSFEADLTRYVYIALHRLRGLSEPLLDIKINQALTTSGVHTSASVRKSHLTSGGLNRLLCRLTLTFHHLFEILTNRRVAACEIYRSFFVKVL
ncbi:MAG: hypothetical protein CBC55_11140 [Gammaproteobacteria bacterium TMED95]|nr:hypothetical protein [Gammaproteobacteria bacterium]OUV19725.1 MAG: hypothetical protein CBC55_11140 [Gammaproteobacteria bacterium TMED95]